MQTKIQINVALKCIALNNVIKFQTLIKITIQIFFLVFFHFNSFVCIYFDYDFRSLLYSSWLYDDKILLTANYAIFENEKRIFSIVSNNKRWQKIDKAKTWSFLWLMKCWNHRFSNKQLINIGKSTIFTSFFLCFFHILHFYSFLNFLCLLIHNSCSIPFSIDCIAFYIFSTFIFIITHLFCIIFLCR